MSDTKKCLGRVINLHKNKEPRGGNSKLSKSYITNIAVLRIWKTMHYNSTLVLAALVIDLLQ